MSKALPAPVEHLLRGTQYDTHRDLSSSSSSSGSSSFRTRPQSASQQSFDPAQDEDLGRFAAGPARDYLASNAGLVNGNGKGKGKGVDRKTNDGDGVQALLSFSSVSDEVYGDWESELLSDQRSQSHQDVLPVDPTPASRSRGRLSTNNTGDQSPTSTELLSSLNSLDIASMRYLSSLLAKGENEAIQDYLGQGSYTDDVWSVPEGARKVLERVNDGVNQESGREKAVKRLKMVMSHLRGDATATDFSQEYQSFDTATSPQTTSIRPSQTPPPQQQHSHPDPALSGGFESPWEEAYSLVAQHSYSRSRTRHSTDSSLATTPTAEVSSMNLNAVEHESDAAASSFNAPLYETSATFQSATATAATTLKSQSQSTATSSDDPLRSFSEVEAAQSGFSPSESQSSSDHYFHSGAAGGQGEREAEKEGEEKEGDFPPFQEFMMRRLENMRRRSFDGTGRMS